MHILTDTKIKSRNQNNSGETGRNGIRPAILSRGDYRRIVAELLG